MVEYWTGNPYKRPNSEFWHVVFEDASGVVRRKSTRTRDLRIARDFLGERLREVEKQKGGHVDRYAVTRKTPLEELVVTYKEHLEAERSAFRYVQATVRQVRDFIAFAKASTLPTIVFADAERFVAEIRSKRSAKTRDHYAGALRGFGRWLHRTGRWDADPFAGLSTRTATKDKHRVFKRVSFRFEEAQLLVEAAWARYESEKVRGGTPSHRDHGDVVRDRQTLYWFALTTAFRANECASINWEDLTLDGLKIGVRLAGTFTKNGDDANIPLQPFVAEALKDMRKRRSVIQVRDGKGPVLQTDRVFHVPDMVARLVRKDAAYAGLIPERGPTSKRVDFHCLRKSCARILIELGLHPKHIQQVLRHSDIRTRTTCSACYLGSSPCHERFARKPPSPFTPGVRPPSMRARSMPHVRHLRNPPITEGLIDLRADGYQLSSEGLRRIGEFVKATHPLREEQRAFKAQLSAPAPGTSAEAKTEDLGLHSVRFRTPDKRQVVQVRADGFTLNQLAPYTGWDSVFPEAMRLWQLFVDVFKPASVKTASVRFINHIQLPAGSFKLEDYLRAPTPVPPEFDHNVGTLFTTVVVQEPGSNNTARITQSIEPTSPGAASTLLLDIEASTSGEWEPLDTNIQSTLLQLRDLKNRVFFAALTDAIIHQYE